MLLFACALCLTAGCGGADYEGPERAPVKGSVTLDGNPLPFGTITFVPAGEGKRASGVVASGQYAIDEGQGPNLGKYKVEILGYAKVPEGGEEEEPEGNTADEEEGGGAGGADDLGDQVVPAKYNAATTLEVEITSGENTHDFTLTSD
jgi:hypothetical protein